MALFLYILLIPLTFPFLGMEGIKVTLRMAWRAIWNPKPPRREIAAEPANLQAASG